MNWYEVYLLALKYCEEHDLGVSDEHSEGDVIRLAVFHKYGRY